MCTILGLYQDGTLQHVLTYITNFNKCTQISFELGGYQDGTLKYVSTYLTSSGQIIVQVNNGQRSYQDGTLHINLSSSQELSQCLFL